MKRELGIARCGLACCLYVDINTSVSYTNKDVRDFINFNLNKADAYLIKNENGGNLLTAHETPHFNPMDEMIQKLIFINNKKCDETIAVEIRETV